MGDVVATPCGRRAIKHLLIINPNSSRPVTDAIRTSAASLNREGWLYTVEQIDQGPAVIEGLKDEVVAAPLVLRRIMDLQDQYDAFLVACHGDPGVLAIREVVAKPVVGIGETSLLVACALGRGFGLITLGSALVAKKWRQIREYGLEQRCVCVEPTEAGVLHGVAEGAHFDVYVDAARRAVARGADVLVLGCASMAPAARAVEEQVGVTVVEPVAAAISIICR